MWRADTPGRRQTGRTPHAFRAEFTVGEYWDKAVQIDVVGLRDDNWTDLGECEWGPVHSFKQLTAELDRKVPAYPNPRNATIGRRLFLGKNPPKMDTGPPDLHCHSLDDLYRLR